MGFHGVKRFPSGELSSNEALYKASIYGGPD